MATEILGLKVNDVGEIILPTNDQEGRKAFFKEFFQTPIGKQLASIGVTAQTEDRVSEVIEKRFGPDVEITLEQFSRVIEQLLAVKDPAIVPPPPVPSPVVEETRARHADGRFKSEFETWATDPHRSMKEIRARAEREPAFREWFQSATIAQTFQDGGLRIAGLASRTPTTADMQVLGEFVRLYQITPSSQLKPVAGFVKLGDRHYTPQEFQNLISQAATAGLI
jgi:hypothetical protein